MKTIRLILLIILLAIMAFLLIEAAKTPFDKTPKEIAEVPADPAVYKINN